MDEPNIIPKVPYTPVHILKADATGRIEQIVLDPVLPGQIELAEASGLPFAPATDVPYERWDLVQRLWINPAITPWELAARPVMPVQVPGTFLKADGKDELVFTGIPDGAICEFEGQSLPVEDNTLRLHSDMPGTYQIALKCWPYIDWEISVEAIA